MDGEYIKNLSVGQHIMLNENCMNIDDLTKSWYDWDWDKPHMWERAYADANKGKMALVDSIQHQINSIFTKSPKAYGELKSMAEASRYQKLLTPIQKSETRFLNHQFTVATHFINNYAALYDYLYEDGDDNVNKINNVEFVLRLNYKTDLLNVMQKVSRNCQQVGLYSWRMYDYIESSISKMSEMTSTIDKDDSQLHKDLCFFGKALRELRDLEGELTFQEKPLYLTRQMQNRTRATVETQPLESQSMENEDNAATIQQIVADLKKDGEIFLKTFSEGFKKRADPNKGFCYPLLEKAFRLENILANYGTDAVPPEFLEYFRLSQKVGYVPEDLSEYEISKQYRTFCSVVADMVAEDAEFHCGELKEQPWKVEQRVFNKICSTVTRQPISDVTDLCLSAMVRAHCEAVCESMGSVVKNIKDQRNVTYENLKEELFISYNGPHPCASDSLVSDALDLHFSNMESDKSWRFHRKTKKGGILKHFTTSKVVDRKKQEAVETVRVPYK